jgi:hypothetical protein
VDAAMIVEKWIFGIEGLWDDMTVRLWDKWSKNRKNKDERKRVKNVLCLIVPSSHTLLVL